MDFLQIDKQNLVIAQYEREKNELVKQVYFLSAIKSSI